MLLNIKKSKSSHSKNETEDSFEESTLRTQENRLALDNKRYEQTRKTEEMEHKIKLMREVKKLQDDGFEK